MTTELTFTVTIRGNVTPEQWRAFTTGDRQTVQAMEDLFRDRLTAHAVTIVDVHHVATGPRKIR